MGQVFLFIVVLLSLVIARQLVLLPLRYAHLREQDFSPEVFFRVTVWIEVSMGSARSLIHINNGSVCLEASDGDGWSLLLRCTETGRWQLMENWLQPKQRYWYKCVEVEADDLIVQLVAPGAAAKVHALYLAYRHQPAYLLYALYELASLHGNYVISRVIYF